MSAAEAVRAARALGIELDLDGNDLLLEAATAPPAAVLDLLSSYKAEILALLRPGRDGWAAEDWQIFFGERAGIAEFDGALPRAEAEAHAFACCVSEWLRRCFMGLPPGRCVASGSSNDGDDALVPHGLEPTSHASDAGRTADAVAALGAMGIASPTFFPDDFGKNGGA